MKRAFLTTVLIALATVQAQAHNQAHPVSIEGNWLVAVVIAVVAIAALIFLVRGVLYIDQRDAWLRRGGRNGDDYWIRD
jgi:hypothetical protein